MDPRDLQEIKSLIEPSHEFFSLSESRQMRMLQTASRRIHHIRLVIQDVTDPHNISACFRSAEAMGIMNVHAVSGKRPYRTSSASRGVDRWLNIQKHSSIAECAEHLKAKGFLLAAGFPEDDAIPLSKLPIEKPIALVFGNEHDGVSKDWVPHLDFRFTIPMSGMVESMNISVSAAISLYEVRRRHLQSRPPSIDHSQTAATAGTWANEHFARLRSKDYSP